MVNRNLPLTKALLSCMLCAGLIVLFAGRASAQEITWGLALEDFKKGLTAEHMEFTPRLQPEYKNKIMTYITAIDDKFRDEIIIIREKGTPQRDYLFVKGKLCTRLDDWDVIPEDRQNGIMAELKAHYGEPSIQKEDNFFINSFKSKSTNVLFYMLKHPDGKAKCKVYYYTSKLFRMLIMDQ